MALGNNSVPLEARFCRVGMVGLARAFRERGPQTRQPKWWQRYVAPVNYHIVGCLSFQVASVCSALDYLTPERRAVREYWLHTKYATCPLLFIDVVSRAHFDEHRTARIRIADCSAHTAAHDVQDPKSMLFHVTGTSAERIWRAEQQALGEHDRIRQEFMGGKMLTLAMSLPIAHALLLCDGSWPSYVIPVSRDRYAVAGLGLRHIHQALQDIDLEDPDAKMGNEQAFTPASLLEVADLLRASLERQRLHLVGGGPAEVEELQRGVRMLQGMHDAVVVRNVRHGCLAFQLEYVVECLLFAGFLRSSSGLKQALKRAVSVVSPDRGLEEHLVHLLEREHTIPSQATLQRHRLTLHVGWCLFCHDLHAAVVRHEHLARWATVDASPQGGYEFVMQASVMVQGCDLVECFRQAQILTRRRPGQEDAEVDRAIEHLAKKIVRRQGVPSTVGSGRASVRHKLAAITHAEKLVCRSWSDVTKLFNSVISFTGDMGTESNIPLFRGRMVDLHGDWILQGGQQADEHVVDQIGGADGMPGFHIVDEHAAEAEGPGEEADGGAADDASLFLDLTKSLFICGLLHVVHNITEGIVAVMVWAPTFVEMLTHLTRLLKKRWSRQRLMASCFAHGPAFHFRGLFSHFSASVYEGRWGSLLHAISRILPLKASLRMFWSLANYQGGAGGDQAQPRPGQHSIRLDLVDQAIGSDMFWAYAEALDYLGETLTSLVHWAESCPCHGEDAAIRGPTRHLRVGAFQRTHSSAASLCPLRTMRAPEMAAGEAHRRLQQLFGLSSAQLVASPAIAQLDQVDRARLLNDFRAARQSISFTLRIKLDHWQSPPWLLAGLGHRDVKKARRCARRALQIFDGGGDGVRHHWLTLALCGHGSQGRDQLQLFARGERALHELEFLEVMAAKLFFIMITERWVESLHAEVHRHLLAARHASILHVAYQGIAHVLQGSWNMIRQVFGDWLNVANVSGCPCPQRSTWACDIILRYQGCSASTMARSTWSTGNIGLTWLQ